MSNEQRDKTEIQGPHSPREFKFENHKIRAVNENDQGWFIADDLCEVLDHPNTSQVVSRLDDDEKGILTVDTLGGAQKMLVVNEFGLFSLILTSRKPEAKKFKRWVTHDVLPSIRKTGRYETAQKPDGEPQPRLSVEAGQLRIDYPAPGRYIVTIGPDQTHQISEAPDESDMDQSETAPPKFAQYCFRRFKDIYVDCVNPDFLLKILFDGNVPYTGNKRFPLLARESCQAIGIDMKDALESLPPLAKGFATVDSFGGWIQREAITEAALYVLIFDRRDHSFDRIARRNGGVVPYHDITDAVAISHQIKSVQSCFESFLNSIFRQTDLQKTPSFLNLERAICNAAQTADLQIAAASRIWR